MPTRTPISPEFRIVIVGGGIAGLASAIALRAPGRRITILEASPLNKEIGAAISLQPNATKIVQKWGCLQSLMHKGALVDRGFQIYKTDGELALQVPFKTETYGADRVLFHRVDLHEGLKELATNGDGYGSRGPPAEIRTSSKVVACDPEEGRVTLANGDTVEGDIIIGADGIHSKIRQFVIGEERDAIPTGLSAYRMIIPVESLQHIPEIRRCVSAKEPWTTMVMAHSCRVIMGPCRNGELLSIVALVPDAQMHEQSAMSWTSKGSMEDLLKSFGQFPEWIKETFKAAPELGLWQLRDLEPLPTWVKGKCILIGDAAHAMLPTQGQGASQSIEDAEALAAFFEGLCGVPSQEEVAVTLKDVYRARVGRATLVQQYSRQQARPATESGSGVITLSVTEFQDYNCSYAGAKDWIARKKM